MTLKCILQDAQALQHAKSAIDSVGRKLTHLNKFVGVKEIQKELETKGINLNNDAIAKLYEEVFSGHIGASNFETQDRLNKYGTTPTALNPKFDKAFKDAGFKTSKGGLDWKGLMYQKTETELRDEIDNLNIRLSPKEVNELLDTLQGNWNLIVGNALKKASKISNPSPIQKNALNKLAEIINIDAQDGLEQSYTDAMAKVLGISNKRQDAIKKVKELGKSLDVINTNPTAMDSVMARDIKNQIDAIIHDANTSISTSKSLAAANFVSKWMDLALLSMVNNVNGVAQNILTGLSSMATRGVYDTIRGNTQRNTIGEKAGLAYLANVSTHNQSGFGEMSTQFGGRVDVVQSLTKMFQKDGKSVGAKVANSIVNLVSGVTLLNGVDSAIKAKMAWQRFISNAEIIYSKQHNVSIKEARKVLNKEIFGKSWNDMLNQSRGIIEGLNRKGANISTTDSTISIFASDLIRAQLSDNKIMTDEMVHNAWNAAVKSAGMSMGHISNNPISTMVNYAINVSSAKIAKATKEGNYRYAALLTIGDLIAFKVFGKFMSGGSNWVILTLETAGMGLPSGFIGLVAKDEGKIKNISDPSVTNADIQKYLVMHQNAWDRIMRGSVGVALIGVFLLLNSDDEEDKRQILKWFNDHPELKKMAIKVLPSIIAWYITFADEMKNKGEKIDVFNDESWKENKKALSNTYKFSEQRNYLTNMVNQRLDGGNLESFISSSNKLDKAIESGDKDKIEKANQKFGETVGRFIPLNPLPTRGVAKYIDYKDEIHDLMLKELSGKAEGMAVGSGLIRKTDKEKGYKKSNNQLN